MERNIFHFFQYMGGLFYLVRGYVFSHVGLDLTSLSSLLLSAGPGQGLPDQPTPYSIHSVDQDALLKEVEKGKQADPSVESSSTIPCSSEPCALEQRANELILSNIEKRKGALIEGQITSDVRKGVEEDFAISTNVGLFELNQQLERENSKNAFPAPATNSAFHELKEASRGTQDGRGGQQSRSD